MDDDQGTFKSETLNKLAILGIVAASVTANAQTTLALYQRENANSTYIWKVGVLPVVVLRT